MTLAHGLVPPHSRHRPLAGAAALVLRHQLLGRGARGPCPFAFPRRAAPGWDRGEQGAARRRRSGVLRPRPSRDRALPDLAARDRPGGIRRRRDRRGLDGDRDPRPRGTAQLSRGKGPRRVSLAGRLLEDDCHLQRQRFRSAAPARALPRLAATRGPPRSLPRPAARRRARQPQADRGEARPAPPGAARQALLDASILWRAQRAGDPLALRRLVEYNLTDAFHLRPLAEIAYNLLVRRLRMPVPDLPVSDRGALLYDVSKAVERACGTPQG